MITNHRVVMPHPADSSVNLVLTDLDGKLVDESDSREMERPDIEEAIAYFRRSPDADRFKTTIQFLEQFLD